MLGLIEFWRNGGCVFDLGWLGFKPSFEGWVERAREDGVNCLVLVVDHFSAVDQKNLGCKAHGCDEEATKRSTWSQVEEFHRDFEEDDGSRQLYAIGVGLNTDNSSLVFRRRKGSNVFDLSLMMHATEKEISEGLRKFYRLELPPQIVADLVPVAIGNIRYMKDHGTTFRPPQNHAEAIIAIGRGLDWFAENEALVIGPFAPNFPEMIEMAAQIVLHNLQTGVVSKNRGAVLLAAAPHKLKMGRPGRSMAERKAKCLAAIAMEVIRKKVPELLPYLNIGIGIISNETRKLNIRDRYRTR